MIIVSQDKEKIINFINIRSLWIYDPLDDNKNEFKIIADNEEIGYYKTKERAKEVLKEITIAYANINMINIPKININQIIPARELVKNFCFEMPKE